MNGSIKLLAGVLLATLCRVGDAATVPPGGDTLTFFENQHIHHGNISMNNIIVQVDEDTGDKTYQLADW